MKRVIEAVADGLQIPGTFYCSCDGKQEGWGSGRVSL